MNDPESLVHNEQNYVALALPDGGYGWTIVASCSAMNFFFSGFSGSWGVRQAALIKSDPEYTASLLAWVGSLSIACTVAFGLVAVRVLLGFGGRYTTILGEALLTVGILASGFTTDNLGGLFATSGALVGLGVSLLFTITNVIPTQYFNGSLGGKLGLATGLIKLGGGIGATVFSVALEALNRTVGISWTFRIFAIMNFTVATPAAWLIQERAPIRKSSFVDVSLFRMPAFTAIFISGAICVFTLYVPTYFLPLFGQSLGLSSSTSAAVVAGFNLSASLGRFAAGPLCDRIGSVNTFLVTVLLNAVSILAIWPVSDKMAPLITFTILNGTANGAFFTSIPPVVTSLVGPGKAVVAMNMITTGWTAGYLMGTPVAGYLIQATRAETSSRDSVRPFWSAIFYAGGIALVSSAFIIFARVSLDKRLKVKI